MNQQHKLIICFVAIATLVMVLRNYIVIENHFKLKRYINIHITDRLCLNSVNSTLLSRLCKRKWHDSSNHTGRFHKKGMTTLSNNVLNRTTIQTTLNTHTSQQTTQTTKHSTTKSKTLAAAISKRSQQCKIPKIDPFHREVLPFISYDYNKTCTLRWRKSRVEKGVLKIGLKNVERVRLNYIKRIDDENNMLVSKLVYNISKQNEQVKEELSIPLIDDFIKVDFKEFGSEKDFSEYHMYPLKQPPMKGDPPFQKKDASKSKYNVLMVMLDSVSHACAQRYLKKTYRYLDENTNTVIMKGHTILGDATTPQISALFFGATPENLEPEGRKGHFESRTIDAWPSVLKDYKQKGYVTVHSEDQAWIGAFNYRLRGFKNAPTFKYLRSWWQRTEDLRVTDQTRADSCPIAYALDYMRDFYKEYNKELSLAYISTSALSHNQPKKIQMFDEGFLNFFKDMKVSGELESTFVVFFGDHGMREGDFRQTLQGQLEERLPFMTITVPPRFIREHPYKYKNLQKNSQVLTTPYDMHVTLKHLLSLEEKPTKHVFGRSLFTDIVKENRTCSSAGVPHSWCVCSEFTPVSSENEIVKNVALAMVSTINNMIKDHECEKLKLTNIIRAGVLNQPYGDNEVSTEYATYEVVFQVEPSEGIFEGSAEYTIESKNIRASKNFSRLNLYGRQPKCIAETFPYLRKYCFCKNM